MAIKRRLTRACTGRSIHASFELILLAACEAQAVRLLQTSKVS
jgi:hypothetical protein